MGNLGAVFRFEWKRAWTPSRLLGWGLLAVFPAFIVAIIRFTADQPPREIWLGFLFALIPMLVSLLGALLTTTTAISSELERRSWVYLAIRPHGGTAVLLGKFLASVSMVIPVALLGLTLALPLTGMRGMFQAWWSFAGLIVLSCPAYAAIFLLLGVINPRRSVLLAVAYSLIFELIISFVPAVINKLTVQYRLRALLVDWCDMELPPEAGSSVLALIGDSPPSVHVLVLLVLPPLLLSAAVAMLRWSEFTSAAESDV
jgi:ABC-type transport system involved in multi-copper enzyme maturation permease subunit